MLGTNIVLITVLIAFSIVLQKWRKSIKDSVSPVDQKSSVRRKQMQRFLIDVFTLGCIGNCITTIKHMRYTFLICILLISSNSKSQNLGSSVSSFEDFFEALEDPSISQQNEAIAKNRIKASIVSKWKHDPNNDTLELQKDSILTYYNERGQIDSTIFVAFSGSKKYNYYDSNHLLTKRLSIKSPSGMSFNLGGSITTSDTTYYSFEYRDKLLIKETINDPQLGQIIITYQWNEDTLDEITMKLERDSSNLTYSFTYQNDQIKRRKSSSSTDDPFQNKSNEFLYTGGRLTEITNTWMLATDSALDSMEFTTEAEQEEISDIKNTKFSYYDSGWIKSFQKVYAMWPGESFWITEYRYRSDGLLEEKEMNNDNNEFGRTQIIYKYNYIK